MEVEQSLEHKWSIRTYKDGDEEKILELWKAVYPEIAYDRDKWLKWWRWMYKENPAGKGLICVADDDGKLAGQSAIIPVLLKIGGETILSGQGVDGMTHPDYRKQGMYQSIVSKVYQEAGKYGIFTGYRFPNENSYPIGIKKFNWIKMPDMRVMIRVLNWNKALKLKVNNSFMRIIIAAIFKIIFNGMFFRNYKFRNIDGIQINKISSWDDRFDELWSKVNNQYPITVIKDKKYLSWRYNKPEMNYSNLVAEKSGEVCGYLVLHNDIEDNVKITHIVELIAQSEDIMKYLISKAVEECRQNNVDVIRYPSIASKIYHRAMSKNGFKSFPFLKGGHFCIVCNTDSISREFFTNPENWLIQLGDSDTM